MVNIINAGTKGGGFRHFSGLLPANPGDGNPHRASVRIFHVPASNTKAIFRGDIVELAVAGTGGDLPANISAPSASVVIGNGGGSGLGNALIAPDVARVTPGDTNVALIAGVVVGFAFTLYTAKNGYQYIPAGQESWVMVETDPEVEMYITQNAANGDLANLGEFYDILANGGQQSTRFGISGVSLAAAPNVVAATSRLRLISSGEQIGNDVTATGNVAKVMFNPAMHYRTSGAAATAVAP